MSRKNVQNERRVQILEALGRCLVKKSFPETSIKEIAKEAGVNHGVLHYYFKSKEDILMNFIDFTLAIYIQKGAEWITGKNLTSMPKKDLIKEIFRYKYETFASDRHLSILFNEAMTMAHRNPEIKEKLKNVYDQWISVVADLLLQAGFDKKISREISREIICIFEGIKIFTEVLDYSSKHSREILEVFENRIISMCVNI
jgi:AcrR family transcriptional regulator